MAGKKDDKEKAPIHLIPTEAILALAEGFAYGAKKYGEHNFREGIEYTRLTNSLMRHALAFLAGEDNDPESGLSHISHIGANFAMLKYQTIHHPELDNRYKAIKLKTTEELEAVLWDKNDHGIMEKVSKKYKHKLKKMLRKKKK